ncbi:MAG: CPBP family intramembrane metalloprotease [Candidatus Cloacimonetes bacterium]|nr:CPBP family intramembrane metalloprotease [Candidatus Cloacimonadota bacterium]
MNFKKTFTIYKKEMLDILRDKRTVISTIVVPIILYPLLMVGISSIMSRQEQKLEEQTAIIYLDDQVRDMNSGKIMAYLSNVKNVQIMNEVDDPMNLIHEDIVKAIITITDTVNSSGFQILRAKISYDESDEKAARVFRQLRDEFVKIENDIIGDRLADISVDVEILSAVEVIKDNIAPPEQMLGFFIGQILPYLLIMLTISGGAVVASDLVAGEKERGTLETILVSAAHRNELVFGKYLTIITISFITVFLNLFSMYVSFQHMLGQTGIDMQNINLPLGNFALVLVAMLPMITLFAAILLSISTFSRNIKEAQSYQMPLLMVGMMAAMITIFPAFELNAGMALIPIVNIALLFKDIMMNNFQLDYFLIVVGSTLILDIAAIYYSIKLFNNESILFRTAEEKSLKFWGKEKRDIFSQQFIFIFFTVILLLFYYIGTGWQMENLESGLIKTQLLLILLPVILILRVSKNDLKQTLRLKKTNFKNYLVAILAAVPIIIIVSIITQLINIIYPIPESYLKAMENLLTMSDGGLLRTIIIIAVLPGICEEILFRGFIINGFKKRGFLSSIVITALLFGIIHLELFKLIPVIIIGIWLGYLVLRTNSLFVPIIAHIINNTLAVLVGNDNIPIISQYVREGNIPSWLIIPAVAMMYGLIKWTENINAKEYIGE